MNEKVYRVLKNGIDVENSATTLKNVALAHANSIFSEDPSALVKVVSTELVESTVATYSGLKCRLRIGEDFETFTTIDSLMLKIAHCIDHRKSFTLIF